MKREAAVGGIKGLRQLGNLGTDTIVDSHDSELLRLFDSLSIEG